MDENSRSVNVIEVALTLQLYAHSTMETKRDAMEKMAVFFELWSKC